MHGPGMARRIDLAARNCGSGVSSALS
jgi:hypothetical protein